MSRYRAEFLWQVLKNHLKQRNGIQKNKLKLVALLTKMAYALVFLKVIQTSH